MISMMEGVVLVLSSKRKFKRKPNRMICEAGGFKLGPPQEFFEPHRIHGTGILYLPTFGLNLW